MNIAEIFKKCHKLHLSKRHDYTNDHDNHDNFKKSAELASWYFNDLDKSYVVLIGTKLARLSALLGTKEPNHESIEDTFLDLVNYCALWAERRTEKE
jgi:RNAse (barnase) inhibitor barstar